MTERYLGVVGDSETVLVQGSPQPVLSGSASGGYDYFCGACRTQLLARNISDGEVYDIAVCCWACGALSLFPALPPGKGIPSHSVMVPSGRYRISSTLTNEPGAVLVAEQTYRRRSEQVGISLPDARFDSLQSLRERLHDLLPEIIPARSASSRTPQERRGRYHRLLEILERLDACIASQATENPYVDVVAVSELVATAHLINRWALDPVWRSIVPTLKHPPNYAHALFTLALASYLTDVGNGIELEASPDVGQRVPDIRMLLSAHQHVAIEVKAPQSLQTTDPFDPARVVERTYKRTKSSGGRPGQLDRSISSILAIGGFHLPADRVSGLKHAAVKFLEHRARPHIAALAFVSMGTLVSSSANPFALALQSSLTVDLVANPHYDGRAPLRFS